MRQGLPAGAQWRGVLLMQASNLCFAVGQVAFVPLRRRAGGHEAVLVAWMYQGAALLTLAAMAVRGGDVLRGWDGSAVLTVLYLGLVPTAAGFYLWNRGAARTGSGRLAAANNLKVPLAVLISWLVFGEAAAYVRALVGLAVVTAPWSWRAGRRARGRRPVPSPERPSRLSAGRARPRPRPPSRRRPAAGSTRSGSGPVLAVGPSGPGPRLT